MRDKIIIISVAVLAIVIGVLVFLSGSTTVPDSSSVVASNQPSAVDVPFTKLMQGTQSSIATRINYLITSSTQLSELWKTIGATGAPPTIDFTKQTVLAIFAGKESTSLIAITKIEDTNARMVSIALTKPDSTCPQKEMTASPYEIVTMPITLLLLTHEDVLTTASCKN